MKFNTAQKYLIAFILFWLLGGYPLAGEAMSWARYLIVPLGVAAGIFLLRSPKRTEIEDDQG